MEVAPTRVPPDAIIIFAHGSTVESANESVRVVCRKFAEQGNYSVVKPAFLDCAQPDLTTAVADLAARGQKRILVIPYFLTLGIHLQRDLPGIVEKLARIYEGVEIEVTAPLDGHPALVDALLDRAKESIHGGSDTEGQAG